MLFKKLRIVFVRLSKSAINHNQGTPISVSIYHRLLSLLIHSIPKQTENIQGVGTAVE